MRKPASQGLGQDPRSRFPCDVVEAPGNRDIWKSSASRVIRKTTGIVAAQKNPYKCVSARSLQKSRHRSSLHRRALSPHQVFASAARARSQRRAPVATSITDPTSPFSYPLQRLNVVSSPPCMAMPVSWKTPEHRKFLKELVPAYQRSSVEGTRKEFWKAMAKSWFERFPLEPPSAAKVAEAETVEKALEAARLKKIKVSVTKDSVIETNSRSIYSNSSGGWCQYPITRCPGDHYNIKMIFSSTCSCLPMYQTQEIVYNFFFSISEWAHLGIFCWSQRLQHH